YLVQEEIVYRGSRVYLLFSRAEAEELSYRVYPVVRAYLYIVGKRLFVHAVELSHIHVVYARFERTHRLEQAFFKRSAHAHDLARRLHLRAEFIVSVREFVERETRHFGYHVVE